MHKRIKIGGDAETGQFIPEKDAARRPKTTVIETINKPESKKKKKNSK